MNALKIVTLCQNQLFMSRQNEMVHSAQSGLTPAHLYAAILAMRTIVCSDIPGYACGPRTNHDRLATFRCTMH